MDIVPVSMYVCECVWAPTCLQQVLCGSNTVDLKQQRQQQQH
jgi:hypothetical protein